MIKDGKMTSILVSGDAQCVLLIRISLQSLDYIKIFCYGIHAVFFCHFVCFVVLSKAIQLFAVKFFYGADIGTGADSTNSTTV